MRSRGELPFLLLLLIAPASRAGPERDQGLVVEGKIGALLDEYVRSQDPKAGGICGSVLVAHKGKVLLNKGYGVADAPKKRPMPHDAMWDWASASKQFTAAAILKLEMQKKLRLSDSIRKHFRKAPRDKKPVQIRHLLNHTSGIEFDHQRARRVQWRNRDAVVRFLLKLPVTSEPGSKWKYTNAPYFLLAALIEKVSGQKFEKYCIRHLFRPAGMKSACFIGSPGLDLARVPRESRGTGVRFTYGSPMNWGYRGSGGAVATARELLQWDLALRGTKILSETAKKKLYEPGLKGYALGWNVTRKFGDTRYFHGGSVGKILTHYLRIVESEIVVALAYSERPSFPPGLTARALVHIVKTGKQVPPYAIR